MPPAYFERTAGCLILTVIIFSVPGAGGGGGQGEGWCDVAVSSLFFISFFFLPNLLETQSQRAVKPKPNQSTKFSVPYFKSVELNKEL